MEWPVQELTRMSRHVLVAGLFTPNDDLAAELSSASQSAGEKLWRMPMEESYWSMMKSGIADMVNTGGRAGGSITAALFLKQVLWLNFLYLIAALMDSAHSIKSRLVIRNVVVDNIDMKRTFECML